MEKTWFKNYSNEVPHDIPKLEKSILSRFEETCKKYKDREAFISFDKKLTYQELYNKTLDLASFFQNEACLQKGDKIIIQSPNLFVYPISLWAALYSGLVVVNMNPLYTSREMKEQIKSSKAKAIVLLSSCVPHLKKIIKDIQPLKAVVVSQPGDLLPFPKKHLINFVFKYIQKKAPLFYSLNNSISLEGALLKGRKKSPEKKERDLEDTLLLQYTGGTTGTPKGVELSQKNILSNIKQSELWFTYKLKKGVGKALNPLPLYHIFSLTVNGFVFFFYGITNVMQANPRQIDSVIRDIKKYPMLIFVGVNTLFKALLNHPEFKKINFSDLKFSVAGGMALEHQVQKQWLEQTKTSIIEGYGLTEASPVVCCNPIENPRDGFIGLPLPSTDVRVVNTKGEISIDKEGELEVKGPQVMKGYLDNLTETNKVLSPDGWLKTGDIALIDSEGFLKILDRKKDIIIVSGFNVYPNEVENVLLNHKKVQEVVIVGIKDEKSSEAVKAFIVKKESQLEKKELIDYCRTQLAAYKIPKEIEFVKEIPKTIIGKPVRYKMKKA